MEGDEPRIPQAERRSYQYRRWIVNRSRTVLALAAATLAAALPIGVALAADSRLDLADDHIEKAIALVEASQNPNAKDPNRPFGNHDARAVRLLEAARAEIAAAKAYADNPKNWSTTAVEPS